MNRTIKFRAWTKRDKCWCGAFAVHKDGEFRESPNDDWIDLSKQDEIILMQFTGLHDRNGKEVYEGDIVRFPKREANNAELVEKLKITLEEVEEAEKGNKDFLHPNGCFNGGSQKRWEGYYLNHRSNITKRNPEGKLSGVVEKHIEMLDKSMNTLIKWSTLNDSEWGEIGIGFGISPEDEMEIIGNIFESPELLK